MNTKTKLMFVGNQILNIQKCMVSLFELARDMDFDLYWAGNFNNFNNDLSKIPCKVVQIDFSRHPVLSFKNIRAIGQLKRSAIELGIDVIHCNAPIGGVCGRISGRMAKIQPIIYTAHGLTYYKGAPIYAGLFKIIEHILSYSTDASICMNEEDYNEMNTMKLRNGGKVFFTHGVGVDLSEHDFSNPIELRSELGIPDNDKIIIAVGRLEKVKNFSLLLEAFDMLNDENVHLVICGRGSLESTLKDRTKKLINDKRVHFLGFRDDVFDLLSISNIYVSTSLCEGLPRSVVEAMNHGLPCIVSDARGNVDIVKHGFNGFIFKKKDTYGLMECLKMLLNDVNLQNNISANARDTAQKYSLEVAKSEQQEIYKEVFKKYNLYYRDNQRCS